MTLVDRQESDNQMYCQKVVEVKAEKGATKKKKNEIKSFNKMLKEERKTALPPVNDTLALNCELLLGLADELNVSQIQKEKIVKILRGNNDHLFQVYPLDNYLTLGNGTSAIDAEVEMTTDSINIPAYLVTSDAAIKMTITDGQKKTTCDDWVLTKVTRNSEGKIEDIKTFTANYQSTALKNYKFSDSASITLEILPKSDIPALKLIYTFKPKQQKVLLFIPTWVFERVK